MLGPRPATTPRARPLDWDESSPAPCVTDKPGWDGSRYAQLLTPELWLPCRFEFTARTPAAADSEWPSAAGNGLAVLLRLAARSVSDRVPMKLDF